MNEIRIGCLLRQVNAGLIQYGKEHMGKIGLSPAQSMMLEYLLSQNKEGYYLTDICMQTRLSRATVSVMLKALRKKGYLYVIADSGDDRKKKMILAQKAYEMTDVIQESLAIREKCIFKDISHEELRNLENTLNKIVMNLKQTTEKIREGKI